MGRKVALLLAVVVAALLAWTAAGPYLAVNAIRAAVANEDASALARQVDFPALRGSLKAQLDERIARQIGGNPDNAIAMFGRMLASGLAGGAVDAMVTPTGLGALMEGRKVWNRASGLPPPGKDDGVERPKPLQDAEYRYESTSRFTATVHDDQGRPVVFVLTRKGLRWKLSDIRLPL